MEKKKMTYFARVLSLEIMYMEPQEKPAWNVVGTPWWNLTLAKAEGSHVQSGNALAQFEEYLRKYFISTWVNQTLFSE